MIARSTCSRGPRRALVAAGVVLLLAPWVAAPAWAAFAIAVQTSGSSFSAYVVPAPSGLACSGLSSPLNSKILWNAVTPPPGDAVTYVITAPGGGTTTTAATSYNLPSVTLTSGQYGVQTQIGSGWRSQPATITVGLGLFGLLYTCSVP